MVVIAIPNPAREKQSRLFTNEIAAPRPDIDAGLAMTSSKRFIRRHFMISK
jgi:hypothetical protein